MFAYVPSPIQRLIPLPESESANGGSSIPGQRMDCDTTGHRHSGEGWARQTCREPQARIADWCRIEDSVIPLTPLTKVVTNSRTREEQQGTGMQANQCWLGTTQASALQGELQNYLGFAQVLTGQSARTAGGGPSWSGPARSVSECITSAAVAAPSMEEGFAQNTGPSDQLASGNSSSSAISTGLCTMRSQRSTSRAT